MADETSRKLEDTTLLRIAKDVGFNGRVEPFWYTYRRVVPRLGFFEKRREKKRLDRIVSEVNRQIGAEGAKPGGWEEQAGERVCNLRVARMGLIKEFKTYLQTGADDGVKQWPHLLALRDRPCLIVPVDFPKPVLVEPGAGEEPFPVASSVRAREELVAVNQHLRIDETFAIKKMVDYLNATERDIEVYEKRHGATEGFWPKFSFVLLRKLVEVSAEKRLPAILA